MLVTVISMVATVVQSANYNAASVDYVTNYVTNYVQSQLTNIQSVTTYTVGQHALGGTVFYVDSTGAHGLVAVDSQTVGNQT